MDECAEWGFGYAQYLAALPSRVLFLLGSIPALGPRNPTLGAMLAKPTARLAHRIRVDLKDQQAKCFVAGIAEVAPSIAANLMEPLLDAGIDEVNPSLNKVFIEPCMRVFGARPVNEYLLSVAKSGTNFQIAGAFNASYWAHVRLSYPGDSPDYSYGRATPESRAAYEALRDVWLRWAHLSLATFVANTDLDVRRSVIPLLCLDENRFDSAHRDLVKKAIDVARAYPDDYIRHRVEVQLGKGGSFAPLPHRSRR